MKASSFLVSLAASGRGKTMGSIGPEGVLENVIPISPWFRPALNTRLSR